MAVLRNINIDKLSELPLITSIPDNALLFLEYQNRSYRMTGAVLKSILPEIANACPLNEDGKIDLVYMTLQTLDATLDNGDTAVDKNINLTTVLSGNNVSIAPSQLRIKDTNSAYEVLIQKDSITIWDNDGNNIYLSCNSSSLRNLSMDNTKITDVADPENDKDAVNLQYFNTHGDSKWQYDDSQTRNIDTGKLYNKYLLFESIIDGYDMPSTQDYADLVSIAGTAGKLKTTTAWQSPNTDGTDTLNFNALPVDTIYAPLMCWDSDTSVATVFRLNYNSSSATLIAMDSLADKRACIRLCRDASNAELLLTDGNFTGLVTDYDGNVYQTVKIGTKVWLQQNIKATKLSNGTPINSVTDTNWNSYTEIAFAESYATVEYIYGTVDLIKPINDKYNNLLFSYSSKLVTIAKNAVGAINELYRHLNLKLSTALLDKDNWLVDGNGRYYQDITDTNCKTTSKVEAWFNNDSVDIIRSAKLEFYNDNPSSTGSWRILCVTEPASDLTVNYYVL